MKRFALFTILLGLATAGLAQNLTLVSKDHANYVFRFAGDTFRTTCGSTVDQYSDTPTGAVSAPNHNGHCDLGMLPRESVAKLGLGECKRSGQQEKWEAISSERIAVSVATCRVSGGQTKWAIDRMIWFNVAEVR